MIIEIIKCIFIGIRGGIDMFLNLLPFYEQISSIKEIIIAAMLGVSAVLVSAIFLISKIINIAKSKT